MLCVHLSSFTFLMMVNICMETVGNTALENNCTTSSNGKFQYECPMSIVVPQPQEQVTETATSELVFVLSSVKQKSGESIIICDWVRKCLFKYCKFITSSTSMEYGEALSVFCIEENNVTSNKKNWWNKHKKDIACTLNEKWGCVVELIKIIYKSK